MSIQMQQKYVKKFYIIHIEFSNSGGELKKKFVCDCHDGLVGFIVVIASEIRGSEIGGQKEKGSI